MRTLAVCSGIGRWLFVPATIFCIMLGLGSASTGQMHHGREDISWLEYKLNNAAEPHNTTFVITQEEHHLILPLKRAGNLILLEAIVDGMNGNLIFDTGSAALVLNSIYFNEGARASSGQVAGGITGATGPVNSLRVNQLQISGLTFSRLNASLSDLGHIESARNIKILGFFGLSLFRDFEVVVDLENGILELYRLNYRGNRAGKDVPEPNLDLSLDVEVESDVVFIEASIGKSRQLFCLDTGAESNVISSTLSSKVLNTVSILRRSTLKGAGTQQMEVLHGIMNQFSIGRTEIKDMQVLVTNLNTMSKFFGKRVSGMLGCEFLEKGVFYINLKKETVGIVFH
ncbi:MAG: pepsin/retropepsin-like aspartic protease family protein [Bacteroidota bacterium]